MQWSHKRLVGIVLWCVAIELGIAVLLVRFKQITPIAQVPTVPRVEYQCTHNGSARRLVMCDKIGGTITWLAAYIAVHEGFHVEGSLPNIYSNPGNLIYVGQRGARKGFYRYAWFDTPDAGWDALENDLRAKVNRGMSVAQILDVWCEGGCAYKESVLGVLGLLAHPLE